MPWHTLPHNTRRSSAIVRVSGSTHLLKAILALLSFGPIEFFFWGSTDASFKVEAYVVEYSRENTAQYPVVAWMGKHLEKNRYMYMHNWVCMTESLCCTQGASTNIVNQLCVRVESLSHVQVFETLGTITHQAPLSQGFSRQEYWCGLPCPPPGDLPDPGIKPASLMSPALTGGFFTTTATWEEV